MKKHIKLMFFPVLVCFLVVSGSFAQYKITLLEERGSEITLNFKLLQYEVTDVQINGEVCNFIKIPESVYPEEKGLPSVPRMSESVIIPNNAEMGLEIVDIQYNELNVKKIVPSRGTIYRHQNPADIPYTFGNLYQENSWYPQTAVFLGKPYILRDIRGIGVYFQPVSYNAALGKIKIAQSITVKIKSIGIGKINVLNSQIESIAPAFDKIYNNHFINYATNRTRYPAVGDGDKMIILCPTTFAATMTTFVDWKNKKGIKTTLYKYPDETGGSGTANVKTFIKNKYTSDKMTYVLLVGDHANIPAEIVTMGTEQAPSDPIYVLMAGDDRYADAFIGRFSATSTTDLQTIVNKVLKYEQEPDPAGAWYQKACGVASDQGSPTDKEWMEGFRTTLMQYNYATVDQIYDPNSKIQDVFTALDNGRSWVNYMGHGNYNIWGSPNAEATSNKFFGIPPYPVTNLNNGTMLPIIIAVTCYNGQFDKYNCMAEVFLKTANKGAILFHGASNSQAWNPPQDAQKEMVKLLCENKYISAGAIIFNGMMQMVEAWTDNDNTYEGWIVFGDPSLMPFTKKPEVLTVTSPASIQAGTQKVSISFGKAIDGRVCLYHATAGIAGTAIVTAATSATVDAVIPNVDKITLVVTARNCVPVTKDITVTSTSIGVQSDLNKNLKVRIFPNPFRTTTNIFFYNPGKNAHLTIYSSTGKVLVSENVTGDSFRWDSKDQASGLYFVRVAVNNKVFKKNMYVIK